MPRYEPGYVYLMQWGDYHKIGQSRNPENRARNIKGDANGPYSRPRREKVRERRDKAHPYYKEPVRVIVKRWCPEDAYWREQELHSQFEARRVLGVRCSEWYRFRFEDVYALADAFGVQPGDILVYTPDESEGA
jgi:hypothetical protein